MIRILCISLCICLSLFFSKAKDDNFTSLPSNPPLVSSQSPENFKQKQHKATFKPSITIIVGALTSTFSITFLVFLYVNHCRTGNNPHPNISRGNIDPTTAHKNSGIDPNVINLLPVFRFSSLRGQTDGLECAVCLTNYEASEVLRLLPQCKHAFHVECVDTWLDAHSTCPLCRYRVNPEDALLIQHKKSLYQSQLVHEQEFIPEFHRISGRHSSACERQSKKLRNESAGSRRSLDSSIKSKKEVSLATVGCFDKPRKDELLLAEKENELDRKIHHRIIVSSDDVNNQRWSDLRPSEMFYIRSELLMSDIRRVSAASEKRRGDGKEFEESGKTMIKERSLSEITSMTRNNKVLQQRRRQQEGLICRWLAWSSNTNYTQPPPPPPPVSRSTSTFIP